MNGFLEALGSDHVSVRLFCTHEREVGSGNPRQITGFCRLSAVLRTDRSQEAQGLMNPA